MIQATKKTHKRLYRFGIATIILVFTMLCITAVCALSMLSAYAEYQQTTEYAQQIKSYYQQEKEEY